MKLKELKKAENMAFINFGVTNTVSGLLAMREHFNIRGQIKQSFGAFWKHAKGLMNDIDRKGEQLHKQKVQGLPEAERPKYVPLAEGYDDFSEDLTIFCEAWLRARKADKTEALMSQIETQIKLWQL